MPDQRRDPPTRTHRPYVAVAPRILVAEDEVDVLVPLTQALRSLVPHAQVLPVLNFTEAVQLLRTTPVDLLITDPKMPGASGLALVRWARTRTPSLPFILMTALPQKELRDPDLPQDCLFGKPFEPRRLALKAQELLSSDGSPSSTG